MAHEITVEELQELSLFMEVGDDAMCCSVATIHTFESVASSFAEWNDEHNHRIQIVTLSGESKGSAQETMAFQLLRSLEAAGYKIIKTA